MVEGLFVFSALTKGYMRFLLLKSFSILAWTIMAISSMIITPVFLLVWLCSFWWDRRRLAAHMMGTFWAWFYQSLIPFWKLHLEGREKVPWNRPVVIVANHRSLVDTLALYKLRRPFKWTSKTENFKLPFIGMVLSLTNSVRIQRDSLRSGLHFISQAEAEIKKGSSVLIFPEGTRSKTKEMRSFKEGAFKLAKISGCGIIPVVHIGTEKTFDRGSWVLKGKANIHIRVLDEIPANEVGEMNLPALILLIRERMEEAIGKLEQE